MFRKAAICAVAFVGASLTEAAKLQQEISKRDGAHGHDHAHAAAPAAPASGYSAPASSYSAPAASYGAPAASYGAPAASYGAPAPSYEEPAPSYGAPAPSYGAPVSYEEDQPGFFPDVTFIIVGILIVVGLSLLFPTYVSLTTVRRKRDVAEEVNPMYNLVERVSDIYNSVVQSETCMERIACEVGGLAGDMGIKETTRLAEPFVPSKYKNYVKQFTAGRDCHKIKCGSLAF
jgi:hypothetical protein